MLVATLILWAHALVGLMFCGLALSQVRRAGTALPRLAFLIALAATALWALTIAGIGTADAPSWLAEGLRNCAWLGFMVALLRRDPARPHNTSVAIVYGIEIMLVIAAGMLAVAAAAMTRSPEHTTIEAVATVIRMMVAVTALVLVQHLYSSVAPGARGGIRLAVIALAAMWLLDLAVYTLGYLKVGDASTLVMLRGTAMLLVAPLFGIAAHRNGDWTLNFSRTLAYQSMSLVATGLYILIVVLATSAIAAIGGNQVRLWQTAFVVGSTTAAFAFFSTPWLRAWIKVKLAKHFFTHRYDYRTEWLRFTDTLGKPGDGAAPLDERIVKAVADLTDSPGGVLLVPDGAGLGMGASWNWDRQGLPTQAGDATLARYLESSGRIVALDMVRAGNGDAKGEEADCLPVWMVDCGNAWVLVPLVHFGKLAGAVLLARPPVDRQPDWEDLDLLRSAGRQVASYLAEARSHEALSEAQRFDEFNRRFAFIMHDIKNLVSQLSLVARNAERHADNPDFRADMIATLQDSAARMNDLLARLSQHHSSRPEPLGPVEILAVVERVAAARRAQHPIVAGGLRDALAIADPARVEQLLGHLVQNAVEASPAGEPVAIMVARDGDAVAIDVVDRGAGMTPGFVRDRLFKPFV
ncbi:MAG: PEP-CTERM system histidine kinase PrsK, partial [Sphingomonas sp.]|nr:PEP-CTERM system histidine kinase PrsK [Sphingomonas sp.]